MALPRTSPASVLFTTYNTLDLFLPAGPAGTAHYEQIVSVIRDLGTDVLAVQEIRGRDAEVVGGRLRRLAGDLGMRCLVPVAGGAGGGVRDRLTSKARPDGLRAAYERLTGGRRGRRASRRTGRTRR